MDERFLQKTIFSFFPYVIIALNDEAAFSTLTFKDGNLSILSILKKRSKTF
jgi:hypothetical protein